MHKLGSRGVKEKHLTSRRLETCEILDTSIDICFANNILINFINICLTKFDIYVRIERV